MTDLIHISKPGVGELAALTTAVCWTVSALCFHAAGRRVGSVSLNLIRLVMAWLLFAVWQAFRGALPLPLHVSREAWWWLGLSGIVGFTLGDLCLFRAFVLVGPRLSMLIMSLAPPMTALMGWLAMGEVLTATDWLGMIVTLSGVAWVVLEQPAEKAHPLQNSGSWKGVLLALGGALGQAVGLVLGKLGMLETIQPFEATQIRVTLGIVGFLPIFLLTGWFRRLPAAMRDRGAVGLMGLGAAAGPFLGVTLLMFAVRNTSVALAQTFVALTPVLIIPFSMKLHGERVTRRAIGGTLVAFVGAAILLIF